MLEELHPLKEKKMREIYPFLGIFGGKKQEGDQVEGSLLLEESRPGMTEH